MNFLGGAAGLIGGLAAILFVMWIIKFFATLTLAQWCMLTVAVAFVVYVVLTLVRAVTR